MPIETTRLLLRHFNESDANALFHINSNPKVMQYINSPDQTQAQTLAYLQQGPLNDYKQYGYGRLACIEKSSERLIGFCGIKYLPELKEWDIGYRFLPEYWGLGLATEACQAVIKYARQDLHLERLVGLALPQNKASIHMFNKLGMSFEKRLRYKADLCVFYAVNYKPNTSKQKDTNKS